MKTLFVMLFMAVVPFGAASALRGPDNDDILARILDVDSPYYYPALRMRYEVGDTTLTREDYYYLYYGYAYQDDYRPLDPIDEEDRLLKIFEQSERPGPDRAQEIVELAEAVRRKDPFSPKNLNFLVYAYGVLGDTVRERINYDRMTKILDVIDGSGTGLKENSPKHVLRFSHAFDLLASKDLQPGKRTVVSRTVEYIDLPLREEKKLKGMYFDFGRVYWRRPEMRPERERRWQFNNLPVRKKKKPMTYQP